MNKGELVELVASEMGGTRAAANKAVAAVLAAIETGLQRDGSVSISGFGTFTRKDRAARMGRNPSTGEPMHISASVGVTFRPGQGLKQALGAPSHAR